MGFTDAIPIIGDVLSAGTGIANAFQARNAFKHRYQDTVADIKAAGLNPALAYGQGGGNPQTNEIPDLGQTFNQGVNTAADIRQRSAQTHLTTSQANLLDAQTQDLITQLKLRDKELAADIALTGARASTEKERPAQIRQAVANAQQDFQWNSASWETRMDILKKQATQLGVDITGQEISNALQELSKPEAQASAAFFKGIGKYSPYLNTAKDLFQGFMPRINFGGDRNYETHNWRR